MYGAAVAVSSLLNWACYGWFVVVVVDVDVDVSGGGDGNSPHTEDLRQIVTKSHSPRKSPPRVTATPWPRLARSEDPTAEGRAGEEGDCNAATPPPPEEEREVAQEIDNPEVCPMSTQ